MAHKRLGAALAVKVSRNGHLKASYTLTELEAVYRAANGACGICGKPRGKRNLALDHCHKTGALRGLLCYSCNIGLGYFKDDEVLLASAIEYLRKSK